MKRDSICYQIYLDFLLYSFSPCVVAGQKCGNNYWNYELMAKYHKYPADLFMLKYGLFGK
jgi:hypothetical protein